MPNKTILILLDSFKGSISSYQAAKILQNALFNHLNQTKTICFPMADGGEGTLECARDLLGGRILKVELPSTQTSVDVIKLGTGVYLIESAKSVGIGLESITSKSVWKRSTWELGLLLGSLLEDKPQEVLIGLGGSGTNDAGMGLLSALGVVFKDSDHDPLHPSAETLEKVRHVDSVGLNSVLRSTRITALCDVFNPLTGTKGATYVYGPQKGIESDRIGSLDQSIKRFAAACEKAFGVKAIETPGAGAAGGLGFALALCGANLVSGAEELIIRSDLEKKIASADFILTGEGKSDHQSLAGKLPHVVAKIAKKHHVPVGLLSGSVDPSARSALAEWFCEIESLAETEEEIEYAKNNVEQALYDQGRKMAVRIQKRLGLAQGRLG